MELKLGLTWSGVCGLGIIDGDYNIIDCGVAFS